MITAVDTNILLDVLVPGEIHGDESERNLGEAVGAGPVMISEPVFAELAAHFADRLELDRFLEDTGLRVESSAREALYQAGQAWSAYLRRRPTNLACPQCGARQEVRCSRCGTTIQPRQHVVADFMIGAHAQVHADRLLTRDRGYYSSYFPDLTLA